MSDSIKYMLCDSSHDVKILKLGMLCKVVNISRGGLFRLVLAIVRFAQLAVPRQALFSTE